MTESVTTLETWDKSQNAKDLAIRHWNKTPLFLSEEERYSIYPWLYEAAEFQKHPDESVLEIGCGTGCDLLQFVKHGAKATGIDVTSEHLRLARERLAGRATILEADATNLPFEDGSLDYVYSHGVLMTIDKPADVVKEVFRVLKPGGRFNIHVYAFWSYWPPLLMIRYGKNWKLHIENSTDPVHIELYSGRVLRRLFEPAHISLTKYEFKYAPWLQRWLGWYLVATGAAPK
jgi:ubiquinone/menaquinone biosynthesis C-methylase UbiE